jgi:hypothetical protein
MLVVTKFCEAKSSNVKHEGCLESVLLFPVWLDAELATSTASAKRFSTTRAFPALLCNHFLLISALVPMPPFLSVLLQAAWVLPLVWR